jgi:hypothetical protein
MRKNKLIRVLRFLPFALLFIALFGLIVMTLWNWLMPALFGWKVVTFWQAIGLVILSKILFGGFHGGPRGMHWRHRMMERLDKMTPEERERFREGLRNTFVGLDAESSKPSAQSSG